MNSVTNTQLRTNVKVRLGWVRLGIDRNRDRVYHVGTLESAEIFDFTFVTDELNERQLKTT